MLTATLGDTDGLRVAASGVAQPKPPPSNPPDLMQDRSDQQHNARVAQERGGASTATHGPTVKKEQSDAEQVGINI